jgi:hypothetical protein
VSYPAGTTSGDFILAAVVTNGNGNTSTPSGWTSAGSIAKGSNIRLTVFWRAVDAGSSVSITPPANSTAYVIRYARPGGGAPTFTAAAATTNSANGSSTAAAPTITTTSANATVISLVGIPAGNTLSLSSAQGFSLQAATTSSPASGQNSAFGLADKAVASTGSVTAPTWQQSSSPFGDWTWVTVAFA